VQLKPSTFARYELILHKQVLPTWEKVPLSKVTFADVGVWVQELSASHLSAASVRQAHRVFSLLLDHAVHDDRLARNPAKGVRLPRVSPAHMVFLTHEQVDQLAVACAPYDTLVRVLAYTVGARRRHCASDGSISNGAGCPSTRPPRRSVARSSSEPPKRTSAASSPSRHS